MDGRVGLDSLRYRESLFDGGDDSIIEDILLADAKYFSSPEHDSLGGFVLTKSNSFELIIACELSKSDSSFPMKGHSSLEGMPEVEGGCVQVSKLRVLTEGVHLLSDHIEDRFKFLKRLLTVTLSVKHRNLHMVFEVYLDHHRSIGAHEDASSVGPVLGDARRIVNLRSSHLDIILEQPSRHIPACQFREREVIASELLVLDLGKSIGHSALDPVPIFRGEQRLKWHLTEIPVSG